MIFMNKRTGNIYIVEKFVTAMGTVIQINRKDNKLLKYMKGSAIFDKENEYVIIGFL